MKELNFLFENLITTFKKLKAEITKYPNITVLLATYNGANYVKEQISSILSQCEVNVKIVISDDCSQDDTINVIKQLDLPDSKILIHSQTKKGGAAKNFFYLIENIELDDFTEFYALSDQDDIWLPSKLSRAVNTLNSNNSDGYSSLYYTYYPQNQKIVKSTKSSIQTQFDYVFEGPGPGCTFVLRKNLVEQLKTFYIKNKTLCDSLEFHDWFIYFFSRIFNFKWIIDATPTLLYRQHSANVFGDNKGIAAKVNRLFDLFKGFFFKDVYTMHNLAMQGNKQSIYDELLNKHGKIKPRWIFELRRKKNHSLIIWLSFNINSYFKKQLYA